jgi:sugar lactone lactonase YvrE
MGLLKFCRLGLAMTTFALLSYIAPQAKAALFVGSFDNDSVLRYDDKTGQFIDVFVPSGTAGLDGTTGLAIGPDNNLYVLGVFSDSVLRFNSTTGQFIDAFVPSGTGGLDSPEDLVFGSDGNLYVTSAATFAADPNNRNTSSVLRYDGKTGQFLGTFVEPRRNGLLAPYGIDFGPDGNLFVSSVVTRQILRYDGKTGAFLNSFAFTPAPRSVLSAFSFGPDGNLYASNFTNNSVVRFNGTTGELIDTFVASGSGGLSRPTKPIFGSDGNLYIGSYNTDSVLRFNGKTGAFIDAFIPTGRGGLDGAGFLAFSQKISVPEPSTELSLLAFGVVLAAGTVFTRKQKASS